MALYLTISEGRTGEDAQPIFASSDPVVIRAAAAAVERAIAARLTERSSRRRAPEAAPK
jgi:hypothetical protein